MLPLFCHCGQVTWRNREAELSDPDFVRNPNAYRTAPSYSSGGYAMNSAPSMPQAQPPQVGERLL